MMSYWEDTITEQLAIFGITLTDEQVAEFCESIQISADNRSMAYGHDAIPNPLESVIRQREQNHQRDVADIERHHAAKVSDLEYTIRSLQRRIRDLENQKPAIS